MFEKIKKEIGAPEDFPGLLVLMSNRFRMYMSTIGVPYLILISTLALFGVRFNISKYLLMIPLWGFCLGIFALIVFGIFVMYIDLRFILPSERRSSTGRDPIILGIVKQLNDLSEKVDGICSDSKLQQLRPVTRLTEAIGKPYPKDGGS